MASYSDTFGIALIDTISGAVHKVALGIGPDDVDDFECRTCGMSGLGDGYTLTANGAEQWHNNTEQGA